MGAGAETDPRTKYQRKKKKEGKTKEKRK